MGQGPVCTILPGISYASFRAEKNPAPWGAMERDKLDFFGLLVTDAVRECSELLMTGSPEVLRNLPYARLDDGLWSLPGVLSRKKQLLPQLLSITSGSQG